MGEQTGISWTDSTMNTWWGCSRVSPGCENCYAEKQVKRFGYSKEGKHLPLWGVDAERKPASEKTWRELEKWDESARVAGVRRRVFVASMADVFEIAPERNTQANEVMDAGRKRLWKAIEECVHLDFQLLTKRPENVARLAPWQRAPWPDNVWLGTTVEDQRRANERIPTLLKIPAKVRFLSCEPLLEDVSSFIVPANAPLSEGHDPYDYFDALTGEGWEPQTSEFGPRGAYPHVDWVIVGGESGPGARLFDLAWGQQIVDACIAAGVPVFFKQIGTNPVMSPGPITWPAKSWKGTDPSEWPASLRVQQFPRSPLVGSF